MQAKLAILMLLLGMLLVSAAACTGGGGSATTPTPLPTAAMSCEEARDTIQAAIYAYHVEHTEWPTADGQPGDIEWTKLVPDFMAAVPTNDSKCDWQVNSDPEGEVCVLHTC